MTTAAAISIPCPNGCSRTVAAEGKEIHYCVIREFGETYREYIGTFDGEIITRGGSNHQVEVALNDYTLRLIEDGLIDSPLAALASVPNGTPSDEYPDVPAGPGEPTYACVNWNS